MNTIARLVTALLIAAGIAIAGFAVSQGLERFRMSDRSVTVKGLAEKDVESDFAVWTLSFRRAGNDFGGVQQALVGDRDKVLAFLTRPAAVRLPGVPMPRVACRPPTAWRACATKPARASRTAS